MGNSGSPNSDKQHRHFSSPKPLERIGRIKSQRPIQEFEHACHISLKFKYFYLSCPKVACSSIKSLLIRNELEEDIRYADFNMFHRRDISPLLKPSQIWSLQDFLDRPDIFKFTFVRNPYTRLLSAYNDKIRYGTIFDQQIRRVLGKPVESKERIAFPEFVEAVVSTPTALMDTHWRNQSNLTCIDTINYDFIGKFENITKDLDTLGKKLGLDLSYITFEGIKTDSSAKKDIYLNDSLKEIIYNKFKDDFDNFSYSAL